MNAQSKSHNSSFIKGKTNSGESASLLFLEFSTLDAESGRIAGFQTLFS
jgi:hypothetical protein